MGLFLLSSGHAQDKKPDSASVIMLSQSNCAACVMAKAFFKRENIAYEEAFIDKSRAALNYFRRLGGKGTPLILVGNQRMQGFKSDVFWQLYEELKIP